MFRSKVASNQKERQRFYLLPGMGRRAFRRKQVLMIRAALAVGLLVSLLLAALLYLLDWRAK